MVLSDKQITERAKNQGMISPFKPAQIRQLDNGFKAVSSGLSSAGYDFAIRDEGRLIAKAGILDVKNFDIEKLPLMESQTDKSGRYFILPPHAVMLSVAVERFKIPKDIITVCVGKSTYARIGVGIYVTPFEPGWEGTPTIEIENKTSMPAKIYVGEGIGQLLFLETTEEVSVSYDDRPSAYQNQAARIVGATL